jgi:hypothetical protein
MCVLFLYGGCFLKDGVPRLSEGGGVWVAVYFCIAWWDCGVRGFNTQRIADAESQNLQVGLGGRWGRKNPIKRYKVRPLGNS